MTAIRLADAVIAALLFGVAPIPSAQPSFSRVPQPQTTLEWARCVPGVDGIPLETIRKVPGSAPELAGLPPVVRRLFEKQEREQRLSTPNLATTRITIDWVYATTHQTEPPIYYFEASKRPPSEEGILQVTVSGWVRSAAGGFVPLGTKSELRWQEIDVDYPLAEATTSDLVPLGILRRGEALVWGMQRAATSSLLLYEVGAATGVRLLKGSQPSGC